jgi:FkbM family methyltransferase
MKASFKNVVKKFIDNVLDDKQKVQISRYIKSKVPNIANNESMFYYINNLKRLGYNPNVVIDIGAYHGEWTLETKAIFPGSKFLMLEAQHAKEQYLEKIAKEHKNVFYKIGLIGKEYNDKVPFYELETGSSVYEEMTHYDRKLTYYPMMTLDSVVQEFNLDGEFFVKLDVQGAELDVLEGATKTLEKVNFILLEASLLDYNNGAPLIAEVIQYMNTKDFVLFDICDQRRKEDAVLFQVDLIFSKRNSMIRKKVNFTS